MKVSASLRQKPSSGIKMSSNCRALLAYPGRAGEGTVALRDTNYHMKRTIAVRIPLIRRCTANGCLSRYGLVLMCTLINCVLFAQSESQVHSPLVGGVYVARVIIDDPNVSYDSIKPILSLRIDSVYENTLLVKYRLGEAFMDVDFKYDKDCECFNSVDRILFAPFGRKGSSSF